MEHTKNKIPRQLVFWFMGTIISCLCISSSWAAGQPKYLIKFATIAPEGSTWITHLRSLDADLRKRSDGQMGFRIYAGGIAGDELNILKKIRIGQIQCTGFSGVGFGQILPMVRVMDLPFLFDTPQDADRVQAGMRDFFADQFRKRGFELLAWAEMGSVYLFSKKPIRRIEDLKGLKVWTWSGDPIAKEMFSEMGVVPIPLSITDVTTALNTGMIDTIYASPIGALALQWHTSLKYMLDLPIVYPTGAVLIWEDYYSKLPKEMAKLLCSTTEKAVKEMNSVLRSQNREAIQVIRDSGVTILPRPSGEDLEKLRAIHGPVSRRLTGEIYPKEILDRVYELLGKPPAHP